MFAGEVHSHRISTHVPTRGTTAERSGIINELLDFNPRPHAGDDRQGRRRSSGRTGFQPTSPRGGRQTVIADFSLCLTFQPTSPRGGRRVLSCHGQRNTISTHVPTRGTTPRRPYSCQHLFHFNPRPHAGDDRADQTDAINRIFQPTSPRGGRLGCPLVSVVIGAFQPTSPRGGRRPPTPRAGRAKTDFNPRPHAGDDGLGGRLDDLLLDFNPRPHAGDDPDRQGKRARGDDFNPRPHAGDDRWDVFFPHIYNIFQPTSPRGGRHGQARAVVPERDFNPRPHAGDDRST